jgi:hypothetical protein
VSLRSLALAAAATPLIIPGQPSVRPWPIGPGPAYRPAAAAAAVRSGRPVGAYRCEANGAFVAFHLEIFADRRVVIIPAGIGVARPLRQLGATVAARGCSYPVRTLTPTGVVELRRTTSMPLAGFFRVWGQSLGSNRIASFVSGSRVRAYVDGRRVRGAPGAIALAGGEEIVLEIGGYVPPHRFFLFSAPSA